jgi:ABC-type glycerol-3-phosphate transport system permease component
MIVFIIIGIFFILIGIAWIIVSYLKTHKLIEKYANSNLLNYQDNDFIPEKEAKRFVSNGTNIILKKALINALISSISIMVGVSMILFSLLSDK